MSLILDFGDKRQGFLFKNSCYSQKLHNERETLQKIAFFGPNLEKMKKMVTNQENKFVLSLYQYIELMYEIWGQSEVKRRSYGDISVKTAISGPKL